MKRLPTHVPGLDIVLGGGLVDAGVYMVQGPPGAGKTILANQVAFEHAHRGGRAIYVTMLAESHTRMLQHLEALSFYDASVVPDRLYFASAFGVLQQKGLRGVVELLRSEIASHRASFVVVDGLVVPGTPEMSQDVRLFVHTLQTVAAMARCQVLLLTSGNPDRVSAEQTMVDGLLHLDDEIIGAQPERTLHVRKYRGGDYVRGKHTFCITDDGIIVFPRFESVRPAGDERAQHEPVVTSGIPTLDAMISSNGLPARSATAVVGRSGAGKTTFALDFISESGREAPGLFVGCFETPVQLASVARCFGFDLAAAQASGALEVLWLDPGGHRLDELAYKVLRRIDERGATRLVVDGIASLFDTPQYAARGNRFVTALLDELRRRSVTTLLTLDLSRDARPVDPTPVVSVLTLVDNLIELELDATRSRQLAIIKMRGARFETGVRRLLFEANGLAVGPPAYGAAAE